MDAYEEIYNNRFLLLTKEDFITKKSTIFYKKQIPLKQSHGTVTYKDKPMIDFIPNTNVDSVYFVSTFGLEFELLLIELKNELEHEEEIYEAAYISENSNLDSLIQDATKRENVGIEFINVTKSINEDLEFFSIDTITLTMVQDTLKIEMYTSKKKRKECYNYHTKEKKWYSCLGEELKADD